MVNQDGDAHHFPLGSSKWELQSSVAIAVTLRQPASSGDSVIFVFIISFVSQKISTQLLACSGTTRQ
jgi:hypothetical protein